MANETKTQKQFSLAAEKQIEVQRLISGKLIRKVAFHVCGKEDKRIREPKTVAVFSEWSLVFGMIFIPVAIIERKEQELAEMNSILLFSI
jgi:hypothetical protein